MSSESKTSETRQEPFGDDQRSSVVTLETLGGPTWGRGADGWEHYASTVRLTYQNRKITVPWRQGVEVAGHPSASAVLESLLMDASHHTNSGSFEEWARDYGYDTDSRKAEQMYFAVGRQTRKLARLLGHDFAAAVEALYDEDAETVAIRLTGLRLA